MTSIFDPTALERARAIGVEYGRIINELVEGRCPDNVPWEDKRFRQLYGARIQDLQLAAEKGRAFETAAAHIVKLIKAAI